MGIAMVANRTREIRPSGMKTGAYGNVGVLGSKGKLRVLGIPLIKTRLGRGMRGITAGIKNKATSELLSIILRAPYFYPELGSKPQADFLLYPAVVRKLIY